MAKHLSPNFCLNFISSDWNGASSPSAASSRPRAKGVNNTSIEVVLRNSDTNEECTVDIGMSATLKSIFNDYADKEGVSLRSLRFTHAGKVLFLSLAANKTAEQLGIKDGDTIHISSTVSTPSQAPSNSVQSQKKSQQKKKKNKKSNSKRRVQPSTAINAIDIHENAKIEHSRQLSHVFEEAQPLFKSIRQQLNSLSIQRTVPKVRQIKKKSKATAVPFVDIRVSSCFQLSLSN